LWHARLASLLSRSPREPDQYPAEPALNTKNVDNKIVVVAHGCNSILLQDYSQGEGEFTVHLLEEVGVVA